MRRLLIAATISVMSFSAFAAQAEAKNPFHGLYFGVGIQGVQNSYKETVSIAGVQSSKDSLGSRIGVGGEIHVGYQFEYAPNWVAGVEGFGGLDNAKLSWSKYNVNLTDQWVAGALLMAGYVWHANYYFYGLIGPSWLQSKLKQQGLGTSQTKTRPGFSFGLGMEQALTRNLHLREQYSFGAYSAANFNSKIGGVNTRLSFASHLRQQFMLALDYQFNL